MSQLVTMTDTNMDVPDTGVPSMRPTYPTTSQGDMQMERKSPMRFFLPMVVVAIVAGVGTGYVLSTRLTLSAMKKADTKTEQTAGGGSAATTQVQVGQVYGSKDASSFPDSAEGVLLAGGANGEGSHHIVREGGESQNVFLTSSVVDLKLFEGHKVLVKGETFKAQHAGWLMDVGQIKVEELNAKLPDWAQKAAEKAQSAGGNE